MRRARDAVIAGSALASVAFAIFAIGGVVRWAQAGVAVLAAIAIGATAFSQRRLGKVSPLLVLLGIAIALTMLQLVPLPAGLREALSPATTALRSDGAELLGISPWPSASSAAGATLNALVNLLTLLAIAIVGLRLASTERGRYRLVAAVAALCGLVAVVTGIHKLLGLRELYGFYEPDFARPILLGPLLNSNSLACLTALGGVLSIGLAAHRAQPGWLRAGWLLVLVACGAVTVGTVSRGATLALLAGSLVTIALLIAQRFSSHERSPRRRARFLASALPMSVLAGCLVVLVIWSNAGHVERQLSQLSFEEVHYSRSKFAAWRSSVELLRDAPWFGVGRGSFEAAFTRVHDASGLATYSHLENEYLQAAVDWGLPGALALAFALLWLGYVAARRWRDGAVAAGALGALSVVAVQSNVDFGLQFLGLAAPVTLLAAATAYVPLRDATRPALARGLRIAHALVLVVGAALLLSSVTTPLVEDRIALRRRPTMEQVRASATRHPLDYYTYAVAAEIYSRAGDPRSIRLLNHAMALHPTHPQLHRMAARMLYAQGRTQQATIEFAAALRTTTDPKPLLAEIVARFEGELAAAAIPIDHPHPKLIVTVLQEIARPDVARAWLTRVLEIKPRTRGICDLMFKLALAGDSEAADIAGQRCADRLPDYQSRLQLARILLQQQNYTEVVRLLHDVEDWQSRRDDKIDAWLVLCDAHRALGLMDEAKRCLRRLDASPDMLFPRRGEIVRRLDEIHRAREADAILPIVPGSTVPTTGSATTP
jgi:O-antigen ligase